MALLTNILAFAFALGVIIFVHEAGHYLVAKSFGVRVHTFSLGFGPRIWGFTRGETEYRVAWIPLGGYVRLAGEHPDETSGDPRDFQSKPRWQRILVYLAGPTMNVLLAIALIAVVLAVGASLPFFYNVDPVIGGVVEGSPAAAAGLEPGDEIVRIDGEEVANFDEVGMAFLQSPGEPVEVVFRRAGELSEVRVVPEARGKYGAGDVGIYPQERPRVEEVLDDSPAEAAGFEAGDELRRVDDQPVFGRGHFVDYIEERAGERVEVEVVREGEEETLSVVPEQQEGVGRIGVLLTIAQDFGPLEAIVESVKFNAYVTVQTVGVVGKLVTREAEAKTSLAGPIEIASMSGRAARRGWASLFYLMGIVSISIAILNLLPIPVLDGGQISILLLESAMRRDLSLKVKEAINLAGLAAIVLLMVVVIYFDLERNLPFGEEANPTPAAETVPVE